MRNSVIDASRATRVTMVPLDETVPDPSSPFESRSVDREIEWTRLALERLPESQRNYLIHVVAHGIPSSEYAETTGRTPAATHALGTRSRLALRRALLQVVLEEGAPPPRARAPSPSCPPE